MPGTSISLDKYFSEYFQSQASETFETLGLSKTDVGFLNT